MNDKTVFLLLALISLLAVSCQQQIPEHPGDVVVVQSSEPPKPVPVPEDLPKAKPAVTIPEEPVLRVDFLDVGHAEATLVRMPDGKKLLINCGSYESSNAVVDFLKQKGITALDAILITHAVSENTGGCPAIKTAFPVTNMLLQAPTDVAQYRGNIGELAKRGPYAQTNGTIGLMVSMAVPIMLLSPTTDTLRHGEDTFLVVKIRYGHNAVLLLGSCGVDCQRKLSADLRADVLELANHGDFQSNNDKLLDAVQPSIAVASAGYNNAAGLPRNDLIMKLNQRRIKLYRTDLQHTISMHSDGQLFAVDSEVPYKIPRSG